MSEVEQIRDSGAYCTVVLYTWLHKHTHSLSHTHAHPYPNTHTHTISLCLSSVLTYSRPQASYNILESVDERLPPLGGDFIRFPSSKSGPPLPNVAPSQTPCALQRRCKGSSRKVCLRGQAVGQVLWPPYGSVEGRVRVSGSAISVREYGVLTHLPAP